MSTRRESTTSVSLFPFLAVLVCAMGALILLLLVNTRMIRQQMEDRARHELAAAAPPAPPPPALAIAAPAPPPVLPPAPPVHPAPAAVPLFPAAEPVAAPPVIYQKQPPRYVDPTYEQRLAARQREHEQTRRQIEEEWGQTIATLSSEQAVAEAELQRLKESLAGRQQELRRLQSDLETAERQVRSVGAGKAQLAGSVSDLAKRRAALSADIDRLTELLRKRQLEREAEAARRYTIIPFDAVSGTSRRPIIIDCQRDRLVLACENITLTPAELDGFLPQFNPLLAGVRALCTGWERVDGAGQKPYVLLIVRPEGTVAFYAARKYLEPLSIPFGYELVGEKQEFVWPETDADLVAECRRAIDDVMKGRNRVSQFAGRGGEPPLALKGANGEFRLDEVERLRNPGRSVQFGGQRIDRDQHTARAIPAAEPDRRVMSLFRRSNAGGDNADSTGDDAARDPNGRPSGSGELNTAELRGSAAGGRTGGGTPPASPPRTELPAPRGGVGSADRFAPGGQRGTSSSGSSSSNAGAWRPALGAGISVQRDIKIRVTSGEVCVADGVPIPIHESLDNNELARRVAQDIDAQLTEWGPAPRGFYWNPRLDLQVGPGGGPVAARLTTIARNWGLDTQLKSITE